jgi:hypothetical protein
MDSGCSCFAMLCYAKATTFSDASGCCIILTAPMLLCVSLLKHKQQGLQPCGDKDDV